MNEAAQQATLASLLMGDNKQEIALGSVGQEQFCRLVAAGHTYEGAYRRAYDVGEKTVCWDAAQRLARAPHIVARVVQIRTLGIKGFSVERDMLLENLLWALNTARENHSTDQVTKIVMAIGKLFGLVIDKVEASVMGQFQVMKDVQVDGSELVFDIGSGQSLHIKGDKVDGQAPAPRLIGAQAIDNPRNSITEVAVEGGGEVLDALQNVLKTPPTKPVALRASELPVDAMLDGPSSRVGRRNKVARAHGVPRDLMTEEELEAEAREERLALYGEDFE